MTQNKILITGGAGYIGSHAILAFQEKGYDIVVIDNLCTGIREAIPSTVTFYEGNAGDPQLLNQVFNTHKISGIIHFAGSVVVPESVTNPLKYYANNSVVSQQLISAAITHKIRNFIFSSTAAVYGIPDTTAVTEESPTRPINPYGSSKLITEWMLRDTHAAHDFSYCALRYFNVAGADPKGRVGQATPNATHLIKVACETAVGKRDKIEVFGTDYPTEDGTCIRDYIHVSDLVNAHVIAFDYLTRNAQKQNLVMNCGYGHGASVKQVLKTMGHILGHDIKSELAPRRLGDPAALISNCDKIRKTLNWVPEYDDLNFIIQSAYAWEKKLGLKAA